VRRRVDVGAGVVDEPVLRQRVPVLVDGGEIRERPPGQPVKLRRKRIVDLTSGRLRS